MSIDRKSFLKVAASGGLGLLFGGAVPAGGRWSERGVKLLSVSRSSLLMGSVVNFQVVAERREDGYEAIRKAVDLFQELDKRLSMYDPDSEMAKLADKAGRQPVDLSEDALTVLRYAKEVWDKTSGRFDVTIEPAMKRWGFRKGPSAKIQRPTNTELKELEQLVGSEKLVIDQRKAYLEKPGMAVDLGGIAGGYALDRALAQMKTEDIAAAFINFSGDIHCFGSPLEGSGWPIHIYNPQTREPLADPVILNDEALSTSGAYQNRREGDKNRSWGHLLLPKEAQPVELASSVTAIHPSAMTADAWSTAGYVGAGKREDVRWVII